MKADQPNPPLPSAPTATGVPGMATEPIPDAHTGHTEPNALQKWLESTWAKLKSGHLGNPKWIALILALAAVGGAWWYFTRSSKKADSALWVNYNLAVSQQGLKDFSEDKSTVNTDAARLARVNIQRGNVKDGLLGLSDTRLASRLKAAKGLEEARDELTKLADEFKNDRTMKAVSFLVAADAEKGLLGIPKEGVAVMGLEVKANSRGQVERYADLLRKAADAIGPTTEAGQKYTADADKYAKDASQLYSVAGLLNAAFNEPDPTEPKLDDGKPIIPAPPTGLTPSLPGETPKAPDKLPDPVNPIKPDDKKPDDKPKPPAPLAPSGTLPEKK